MITRTIPILFLALFVFAIVINARKRGWRTYTINLLIAFDQLGNAIIGGMADETISSRCGRGASRYWYWKVLGRILNAIQPNHIEMAVESEKNRLHEPEALR